MRGEVALRWPTSWCVDVSTLRGQMAQPGVLITVPGYLIFKLRVTPRTLLWIACRVPPSLLHLRRLHYTAHLAVDSLWSPTRWGTFVSTAASAHSLLISMYHVSRCCFIPTPLYPELNLLFPFPHDSQMAPNIHDPICACAPFSMFSLTSGYVTLSSFTTWHSYFHTRNH